MARPRGGDRTAGRSAAVSVAAFGVESWHAFFEWMPVTSNAVFAEGRAGLDKLQSLLGVVRWLGGSMTTAWIAQGRADRRRRVAGLGGCGASACATRSRPRRSRSAALLATPYLYIYDFPVLAIPLAFLLRIGLRDGFLPYELSAIAVACGLILASPVFALPTGLRGRALVVGLIARRAVDDSAAQAVLHCENRASIADKQTRNTLSCDADAQPKRRRQQRPTALGRTRPMSLIIFLIVGAVAGWLAGLIVRGYGFGLIGNIVVGIVGGLIAGCAVAASGPRAAGGGIVGDDSQRRHRCRHPAGDHRVHPTIATHGSRSRVIAAELQISLALAKRIVLHCTECRQARTPYD